MIAMTGVCGGECTLRGPTSGAARDADQVQW